MGKLSNTSFNLARRYILAAIAVLAGSVCAGSMDGLDDSRASYVAHSFDLAGQHLPDFPKLDARDWWHHCTKENPFVYSAQRGIGPRAVAIENAKRQLKVIGAIVT